MTFSTYMKYDEGTIAYSEQLTSSPFQTLIVLSCDDEYIKSVPPHFIHVTDCV